MKSSLRFKRTDIVELFRQFLLFAGVGAVGTIGHYITLVILVQFADISPLYASTCGFVVGAVINYYLNYHFTFNSNSSHAKTFTKFILVAALGACINGTIMLIGTEWMDSNYLIVQVFATGVVLMSNFTFNRLWTFSKRERS